MLFDTFNQIFSWVFILTNIVFCALLFGRTYASYRATESKTATIIKAVVCFVVWIIATLIVVIVSTGYFSGHALESAEPRMVQLESATVYLISFILGWILVGTAILFWMSGAAKRKV